MAGIKGVTDYAGYDDYCAPIEQLTAAVTGAGHVNQYDLSIAGHNVRLRSPYQPLIDTLKPAIEHLVHEVSDEIVDLEIFLIDLSRTGGLSLSVIPWEPLLRRGHRGISVDGMYLQYVHIAETDVRILSAYDSRKDRAYYFVSSTEGLPWYISGAPMHEILYWWVRSKNMHILHCGVVGKDDKGIALLGGKGAGKSTMVLSCLERGFQYVSEDYCIVTNSDKPVAYNLYNSAKFTDFTFEMFPHLLSYVKNDRKRNDKTLVYYKDIYSAKITSKLPLEALISLNLDLNATASLTRVDMDKVFLDMISSTTLQNPIFELSSTDFFQGLKSRLPGYELTHGSKTDATFELLAGLL
ncbi:MAG: hypothetical protein GY922_00140 [Proteobacteria bacterium]|nr:hypothetical protein [Pseudomonadota bacterium]MDG2274121.1 hypothetical protein [Halioglobus sp.]